MASPRQRFFFFLPLLFSLAWSGSVLAFEQDAFHNFSRDGRDASPPPPQPRPAGIDDIMSRHTASTILGDGQLRRSYMALVSMLSDTSRDVASRYGLSELGMFSDHLDDHLHDVNANTDSAYRLDLRKRDDQPKNDNETAQNETGMLKDFRDLITELMKYREETAGDTNGDGSVGQVKLGLLGGLFGGLFGGGKKNGANNGAAAGGAAAGGGAAAAPAAGGGGGGGLLGGLANLIPGVGGAGGGAAGGGLFSGIISNVAGGIFNKLLSATGNGLAGTGFFGGVGVGEGAAQGLNLATADKSKAAGEKVAQDNNMKNTGLNPIVQNAAMGLSATAVKAVVGSGLISLPPLPVLAASLGNGIGSGGAMGLGLTQKNLMPSANGSSQVVDAVGSFGFGTAMSFLGNMNTSGGLASMLPNIDFAAAASTVGTGLGSGAALGLKLTNNTQVTPPAPASQSDIPGIAGTFAFDLSRSFTGSIDGSSVGSLIPTNLDIGGAALNVGTGLGSGAARGLKLTTQDVAPPKPQSNTDVPGIAGTFAFGLSNSFTDNAKINLNSLGTMLPPIDFGSAALNVGNGLGKGAALGLKLTTDETGGGPEMMPAGPTALSAADVPKIAGTFALGLSRSFTGAVNVSNLGLGNALPADFDLGGAVSGAGRGLGSGASAGLGLTNKNVSAPVAKSSSDIPGLAEAFTFALSNSFTDNVNISAQAKNVGAMLPPIDIAATAMNAGAGLGLGAARGLNLTTNRELAFPPPKTLNDFPGVAGTFLFGLSDSFTGGINTSDLFSKLKSGFGGGGDGPMMGGLDMNLTSLLTKYVAPAAAGLGKGLGKGAAIGLDLQPDAPADPAQPQPNGGPDIERITEGFAEGLSSRFLANGTTGKALKVLAESTNTTGSPTSLVMNLVASIDVARAVNGFTQGLITGGGDGIMAIGGINAVLNGTSTAPTAPVADTNITFNDSVGGAAIGLGQGLGSSGVVTLQKLLAKGVNLNPMLDSLAPNKTKTKREDTTDVVLFGRQANSSAPPQETPSPSPSSSMSLHLSNILNAEALTVITQKGVDVLTCDGVAGLFLVLAGFQKSGTLSVSDDPSKSNSSAVQGLIPDGTIRIYSEGNKFEIDGQKLRENLGGSMLRMLTTLTINDRPIGVFAVFLVLHIGGAILALLFLFPSVLTYDSLRDILVRLDRPGMLPTWPAKASRWVVMIVVAPSLVVIPIFGILAASSSNHFRTAHGILSIFTLLVAYAAVGLWFMAKPAVLPPGHNSIPANCPMDRWTYASKVCSQLLFALLLPTAGTGFADLNRVTLCLTRVVVPFDVAIMLGVGLGFVFVLAQYVTGAEMIMVFTTNRLAKKRSKELGSDGGRIQPVSEFPKA
ncbi:hypothetical protein AAL_05859 [Moelleriella libera RCEF 2490]|uniref:Uncharacterized protein n=1 Tax=Moelleriella libera RCEF 2490 TaxID=1081109 RepID=A0A167ZLQ8_9HYPO|nr:hypothetical protein AAL_05859 [Moelleriella libera RCEF 2490]